MEEANQKLEHADQAGQHENSAGGVIENVAMLDLTGMNADDLARIAAIRNVATILVPEHLNGALAGVRMENIASVIPLPAHSRASILSGQLMLSGEAFTPTDPQISTLVIVGQAIITSPVRQIGYQQLVVTGQLIAPKESEGLLMSAMTRMSGQIIYYNGDNVRLFIGEEQFSAAFLDLFDTPTHFVVIGEAKFLPDVTAALIKEKLSGLTLIGELHVTAPIEPIVRFLAAQKFGEINIYDPSAAEE